MIELLCFVLGIVLGAILEHNYMKNKYKPSRNTTTVAVLEANSLVALSEQIQAYLNAGWSLSGGIEPLHHSRYFQVMTKS